MDHLCGEVSESTKNQFRLVNFIDTPGLVDGADRSVVCYRNKSIVLPYSILSDIFCEKSSDKSYRNNLIQTGWLQLFLMCTNLWTCPFSIVVRCGRQVHVWYRLSHGRDRCNGRLDFRLHRSAGTGALSKDNNSYWAVLQKSCPEG